MKKVLRSITTLFLATMLFASCLEDAAVDKDIAPGGMKMRLALSNAADAESGTAGTTAISKVSVYRFDGNTLAEVLEGLVPDASGVCLMPFKKQTGTIYCLANVPEGVTAGRFTPGVTSLDDFLLLTASDTEMASQDPIALMGMQTIFPSQTTNRVSFDRTVARVDLSTDLKSVQIHRVKVKRIADRGFLNKREDNIAPPGVQYKDSLFEFTEPLVSTTPRTLLYLCEQENVSLEFEIYASSDGALHKLKARLPDKIVRNSKYTLKVRGNGVKLEVEVQNTDWLDGTTVDSTPESTSTLHVDADTSVLPEGVRLNATRDTLRISYRQATFDLGLVLSAGEGARLEVNGKAQGVTVTPPSGLSQRSTRVSVTRNAALIGRLEEKIFLDVLEDNTLTGRVVLLFEMHPVRLSGRIHFKETSEYDFGNYVDGELGVLTMPDGWNASLSLAAGEPWMKLASTMENLQKMRVLAGWRPNDPLADGREQSAILTITDTGGVSSQYTIKRRNQGLPVVNIDGTWWCKYNLRGNSTAFADQIQIGDALPSGSSLYEYLQSCPEEELLKVLGLQYQGGNPQGLPLAWNAERAAFYHEGMLGSGMDFNAVPDSRTVPPGYRLPRYADYEVFSKNNNYNLGRPGTRTFYNKKNQAITVSIAIRNVRFLEQSYGGIGFYEFRVGNGEKVVLCGLGHQWSTTPGNIAPTYLLFATKAPGKSWVITGSVNGDGTGGDSHIKFEDNNVTKTRTLRAIKEAVEYIY